MNNFAIEPESMRHEYLAGFRGFIRFSANFPPPSIVSCPTRLLGAATSILDQTLISNGLSLNDPPADVVEDTFNHRVPICRRTLDHSLHFQ